ncbi:MAG: DUF4139 domain-containing protein [Deltaproteobacteria bacterium]|nr:DUF4139 domain-containing protein [Deltaproteobacteria bacterium]
MKRLSSVLGAAALAALVGCGPSTTSYVKSNTTLGRVVVYRNGIAYFERFAHVEGDTLKVSVPMDKLDDFLKSLTVTDAKTGQPAPISYPTTLPASSTGLVDLEIRLGGPSPHDLKLTYVTEAPSWKPSYRVVLGEDGKVTMEGWAVVDNTSGEDWENVKLGVGSSSALSFKFDLKSVRVVSRDTLHADDLFAVAPPTGGAIYGGEKEQQVASLDDATTEKIAVAQPPKPAEVSGAYGGAYGGKKAEGDYGGGFGKSGGSSYGGGGGYGGPAAATKKAADKKPGAYPPAAAPTSAPYAPKPPPAPSPPPADANFEYTAQKLVAGKKSVVVEGYATEGDADKAAASLERANKVRAQLVARGIAPDKIVAVGKGLVPGKSGGVRIIEVTPKDTAKAATPDTAGDPIGTSHFESGTQMSVKKAQSAMISIVKGNTKGEVVYFYDPESARGNATFPFRAIRLENPTDSTLESGPVTVFGEGKFIGEGISEPIPPRASAFVPFALDRQIVVETGDGEKDEILRILAVQRGVFSTESKHTKTTKLIFHNRLPNKAKVNIRHTTPKGYTLDPKGLSVEKIGSSNVLGVELPANGKKEVVIEESTPIFKTIDLRSPGGLDAVKVYVSSAAVSGPLKEQVTRIVKLQQEIGNLEQRVETKREEVNEYRARIDELHMQIFTLKAVKTAGPLMNDLEKKMQEMSNKLTKATIDLVNQQEQLMMAKIRLQDAIAELTLKKDETPEPTKDQGPAKKS